MDAWRAVPPPARLQAARKAGFVPEREGPDYEQSRTKMSRAVREPGRTGDPRGAAPGKPLASHRPQSRVSRSLEARNGKFGFGDGGIGLQTPPRPLSPSTGAVPDRHVYLLCSSSVGRLAVNCHW